MQHESEKQTEFSSTIEWRDDPADCVVVGCCDPRFARQNDEFVRSLGFSQPMFIQVPSSSAVLAPDTAADDCLHAGLGLLLAKAVELTGTEEILCIGHVECGGYRSGEIQIVHPDRTGVAPETVRAAQHDHLREAAQAVSRRFSTPNVRAYYSDVERRPGGADRVQYSLVGCWRSGQQVD